jgi:hypothetical protein
MDARRPYRSLQADDVLGLYDWLAECTNRPQQQVGEYDWSSGHSKAQDGGPNAHAFNKGPGGKQKAIRPIVLGDAHGHGPYPIANGERALLSAWLKQGRDWLML